MLDDVHIMKCAKRSGKAELCMSTLFFGELDNFFITSFYNRKGRMDLTISPTDLEQPYQMLLELN